MKRKNFKKLLTTLLSGMAVLTVMTTPKANAETDGKTKQPTLSITKELQLGQSVRVPNATFKFKFTPVQTNSVPSDHYKEIPIDGDNIVEINVSNDYKLAGTGDNYVKVQKEAEDLFKNINWPHAGQYKYTVTEIPNTYTSTTEEITYDDNAYNVYINVKNSSTGDRVIDDIFVTTGEGTTESKVEDEDVTDGKINLPFVNIYNKTTNGGVEEGVNNSLEISKEVTSSNKDNDLSDKTKQFNFTMTLTKVGTLQKEQKYTYVKFVNNQPQKDENGQVVTTTVSTGIPFDFTLAHNEKIVFQNLPGGTTYEVVEEATPNYKPSYSVREGENLTQESAKDYGQFLKAQTKLVVDTDEAGKNATAYTNTFNGESIFIPGTGVLTNNFPFILLILLGVAAFGVNVVVKRRHSVK